MLLMMIRRSSTTIASYRKQWRDVKLTLQPGEIILYESHLITPGQPFPLRDYYAKYLFVHFEPIGCTHHQLVAEKQQ